MHTASKGIAVKVTWAVIQVMFAVLKAEVSFQVILNQTIIVASNGKSCMFEAG